MSKINLERTAYPDDKIVFFAMPYGQKEVSDGTLQNFEELYKYVYAPAVEELGLEAHRADRIFGTSQGVLEAAWHGVQQAGVVVVDFSTRSADVALEFGWAMCLHKKVVLLAENLEDIPTDVRGLLRPIIYSLHGIAATSKMTRQLKAQVSQSLEETVSAEMTFTPLDSHAEPSRASVVTADPECVIVRDLRSQRIAEMRKEDVDYRREVPLDMSAKFKVGWELEGTIIMESDGRCRFSQRVGQRNPWTEIKSNFPQGHVFTSRVIHRAGAGAFVAVAYEVNGYVPAQQFRSVNLQPGAEVEVVVTSVDVERQRIQLALAKPQAAMLPAQLPVAADYPKADETIRATVRVAKPEHGFILVDLDEYPRLPKPAMLHATKMSEGLRIALAGGQVSRGDALAVAVVEVAPDRSNPGFMKVQVRDVESGGPNAEAGEEDRFEVGPTLPGEKSAE